MAINVNDIVGKGFVFEVSAEQIVEPSVNGTISAFIGCANTGPVGRATLITGGLREFYSVFGNEPSDVNKVSDFGWYAAAHHFKYSQIGYFTRVANSTTGNLVTAGVDVARPDTNGKATGSVTLASNINVPTSGALSVVFGTTGGDVTVSYTVPASETAFIIGTSAPSNFDWSTTNEVLGVTVVENGGAPITANVTLTTNTVDLAGLVTALNGLFAAGALNGKIVASTSGGFLKLASVATGATTTITIVPGTVLAGVFVTGNRTDSGANVLRSTITNGFNAAANTALSTSGVEYLTVVDNKLVVTNLKVVGEDSTLQITSNAISTLLFGTPVVVNGLYNQILGRLVAVYPGTEGNSISAIFTGSVAAGNQVVFYYQNKQVTTISNFSYVPTASNYIGTLIENDSFISGIVAWTREDGYPTNIEPITNISYVATGGKSGGFNAENETYPTKADVITAIETYGNADLYNIDLICYPAGGSSYGGDEDVQTTIQNVCEGRQDCFGIIDPPANIDSVANAIRWMNGDWAPYRSSRLESFYLVTYFPKLKVRFANNKVATVSPSVRAAGQIANSDKIANNLSFYSPAGQQRGILGGNVVGLALDLSQKDKDLLYADTYNGRINPISFSLASGYFLDGNKTLNYDNNSLRRINTMRTILYVKKRVQAIVPRYFYEPSSPDTWAAFRAELAGIMKFLEEKNAIEPETDTLNGWKVICDASNNTAEVTNRNGMVAEISYVGIKSIERIKVSAEIREKKTTITVSA